MTRTLRNSFISTTIANLMMLALAVSLKKHDWIWAALGGLLSILAILIVWGLNELPNKKRAKR